ncbi:MAG TPA: M1 family metallopeptidase, partial [Kofleriaceae bacterium]|nr:M1 family metallopeptidase [Kofleriaceae bacterium]
YALDLSLDPARDSFDGTITIDVRLDHAARDLWLHGKALTIDRATITSTATAGAAAQDATATEHGEFLLLSTPEAVPAGPATIRIAYHGQAPVSMSDQEGLFRQAEDGATYLYSQFEATGARRAFPCFDEPSFKVPWQLTLHVPAGLVAVSNTPIESERDDGDRHTVVFTRTPPLPSYLVALAVGPFDVVDLGPAGVNHTPVRAVVPHGRATETRYLEQATPALLAGLERYLGLPFPYPKLDLVAIPTFLGAMENPGMITYASKIILAKPSEESADFQQELAGTVAHEMAHHWFGDLVTMSWWDDIWLNESFADFMADRVVDDWQPRWSIRLHRLQAAQTAFAADSLVSARKIHNPIREHNDIVGAFDAISYEKGGAVLSMFEAWIGRDTFQKVLHDYLTAHAGGNAGAQDFIDALAKASRPDISTAFASFLEQGGIPLVSLDLACTGDRAELVLSQERFLPIGSPGSADQTWTIPMCVATGGAAGAGAVAKPSPDQCFLFSGKTARVPLTAPGCPAWVDGNAGGRGYYRVRYTPALGAALLATPAIDSVSRAAALYNLRAMVDAGHAPMSELLAVIPAVAADKAPELTDVALDLALGIDPFVADDQRAAYVRFLGKAFAGPARAAGWTPHADEAAIVATMRPKLLATTAVLAQDPKLLAQAKKLAAAYLRKPTTMDPGLAAVALAAATHAGDDALARKLEAAFAKTEDHNLRGALLGGMVLAHDPAVRAAAIAHLGAGDLTLEELITLIFSAAGDPTSRGEVYAFVSHHLDQVLDAMPFLVRPAIVRVTGFYCDAAHRADLDTIFRPKVEPLPGGDKEVTEAAEALDLCIAKRAAVAADVAAFLAKP